MNLFNLKNLGFFYKLKCEMKLANSNDPKIISKFDPSHRFLGRTCSDEFILIRVYSKN